MSQKIPAVLLALFLLALIFAEAWVCSALGNGFFKAALAQLGLWATGVTLLLWALTPPAQTR